MADERVSVPNIGDAQDVAVVEVLVAPGAKIEKDQALVVLESDKASMEIPSPLAGTVKEVSVKVGDSVSEGSLLLVLETGGEAESEAEPKSEGKPATKSEGKAEPKSEGEPEPKATVADRKQTGAEADREVEQAEEQPSRGSQGQPTAEDAAAQQEPAAEPASDDDAESRAPPAQEPPQTRTIPPAPPMSIPPPKQAGELPYASPAIRRFARELGVDLAKVGGTGKHARITKDDLLGYVKKALTSGSGATTGGLAIADAPEIDFSKFGETSLQPLTKIQRITGKNLHRSWVTIPHVTQFDEADITELEAFRKKVREKPTELKLTLLTFLMKAVVATLKAMPRFNSSLDKTGENLILKSYFHLGVAVDTPNGLVVPVIRDVDKKSLGQLAKELEDVSERARARRLSPNDLQGASMTISSLGGIGGTAFTPIINPPEVAVLGESRAKLTPVYVDGQLVPRLLCPLSLSYDHRVIDGADAARFTKRLGEYLADIRQLLL